MLNFLRKQPLPIGLDIGHDSIKMLQLELVGDGLSVLAAARQPMPEEARSGDPELLIPCATELIRQMLRQNPFDGRRVVAALPRSVVMTKNLRLPNMPAGELESAVTFEARSLFPFDPTSASVRCIHAGEVRQGSESRQEVIVVAARNDDVELHLERLDAAGLEVESIDYEPVAIYRSVERFIRRRADESHVNVLVDVGERRSQVIIGRGHDVQFIKPIELGGQQFNAAVSRKLNISLDEARGLRRRLAESTEGSSASAGTPNASSTRRDPVRQAVVDATRSLFEELAREVSLCLRYFSVTFRGQRPTTVRLVGGEAHDPQLLAVVAAALPVPVECARPLASIDSARMKLSDRRGSGAEWALAIGLSLKMTTRHFGALDGAPRTIESGADLVSAPDIEPLKPQTPTPAVAKAVAASAISLEATQIESKATPAPTARREAVHA